MKTCDNPKCGKTSETELIESHEIIFRSDRLSYAMPEIDLCGLCAGNLSATIIAMVEKLKGEMTPDDDPS